MANKASVRQTPKIHFENTVTGIVANEHTDGDHIMVAGNIHGLEIPAAHHASRLGRVGALRNTYNVTVTGKHGFSIAQLDIEKAGPGQTSPGNTEEVDKRSATGLGVCGVCGG